MKKKTQKKIKTVIIKGPKPVQFDLSFEKPNENTKILAALESLKTNPGWQFLVQVFEANIKYLENQILTKTGEDGRDLDDKETDDLRFKRKHLVELLAKPDQFMKQLKRTDTTESDLDPYDKGEAVP